MKGWISLAGGLTGALVLTAMHETLRRKDKDAPRMDLLGMESLQKGLRKVGAPVPNRHKLFIMTLLGDILGNALYYSLSGMGGKKKTFLNSTALGLAGGLGGVLLPKYMGLHTAPSARTNKTKTIKVAYYLIGGLATSLTIGLLEQCTKKS